MPTRPDICPAIDIIEAANLESDERAWLFLHLYAWTHKQEAAVERGQEPEPLRAYLARPPLAEVVAAVRRAKEAKREELEEEVRRRHHLLETLDKRCAAAGMSSWAVDDHRIRLRRELRTAEKRLERFRGLNP